MSDLRFPYRWLADPRFAGLSDGAFRGFVNSFAWSVEQRTDGLIHRDNIPLVPRLLPKHVDEYVQRELWRVVNADVWLIVDYAATQTSRSEFEILEHARAVEREKKARQRARKRAEATVSPGTNGGTAQERTGQAGKAGKDGSNLAEAEWHVRYPPETRVNPETGELEELI